ncbi:MAG TPA: GNAT family N-acetyltransferase [Solirubrobacterales bacterium]|nr:GNAT family N-acetyltransferase [Solirubrobacterales bacterium]
MEEVRVAGEGEREAVAAALAEAFMDDPVAIWATPSDRHRPQVLRRFFGAVYDQHVGEGTVYIDPGRRGAAIWALPGHWRPSPKEQLRTASPFVHPRHWQRFPRIASGFLQLERAHPKTPEHFYLPTLGVAPDRQGQGLGSRLLAPILNICDSDGIPAYLESSKHSNIAFYARHGFRVLDGLHLPGGGPVFFRMWRDPR